MINNSIRISLLLVLFLLSGCSNSTAPDTDSIPSTSISFSLQEAEHVKLWVENAYQTKVATLVDEHLQAGQYTFTLEMKDAQGNRLPGGLYTYYLETESASISQIIIL